MSFYQFCRVFLCRPAFWNYPELCALLWLFFHFWIYILQKHSKTQKGDVWIGQYPNAGKNLRCCFRRLTNCCIHPLDQKWLTWICVPVVMLETMGLCPIFGLSTSSPFNFERESLLQRATTRMECCKRENKYFLVKHFTRVVYIDRVRLKTPIKNFK